MDCYGQSKVMEVGKGGVTQEFIDSQDGREVPCLDQNGRVVGKVKLKVAGACLVGDFFTERPIEDIEREGIKTVRLATDGSFEPINMRF